MPLKENLFKKVLIKDKITKIAKSVNLIIKIKIKFMVIILICLHFKTFRENFKMF